MKSWKQNLENGFFQNLFSDRRIYHYWRSIFDKVHDGEIDTWAYQWVYTCLITKGLSIVPSVNLISNLGFREDATHTSSKKSPRAALETTELVFPLTHPSYVQADEKNDRLIYKKIYKVFKKYGFYNRLKRCLKAIRLKVKVLL